MNPLLRALCLLYDAPKGDGYMNTYAQASYNKARSAAYDVLKENGLDDYWVRVKYVRDAP